MVFTNKIQRAIRFAIKTHEVYQKQTRKGKDIPYITHPLTVGLILARAGADEDTVVAGILHDVCEDSAPEKKVSSGMLTERFGQTVADLVESVTESDKSLAWAERKAQAIEHITNLSHESVLVKSADLISNVSELLEDYRHDGNVVFERFNAPKEKLIANYLRVATALIAQWPEGPLVDDLRIVSRDLHAIEAAGFMSDHPAQIIEYGDYDEHLSLVCAVCGWEGTPQGSGLIEYYDDCLDVTCPNCGKMLLVAGYPLIKKV